MLRNLAHLDLSHNMLTEIPLSLGRLRNLVRLDLQGNDLPVPTEILSRKNEPERILRAVFDGAGVNRWGPEPRNHSMTS